jgi:hypothetical protein
LSGTSTKGTPPSSWKASTCSASHVVAFWSKTIRANVTRKSEHHHEDPRPTKATLHRVVQLAHVPEVDLRHLARRGLDRDRDVLGTHARLPAYTAAGTLDR